MPTIFNKVVKMKNVVGFMQFSFGGVQGWTLKNFLIDRFARRHRSGGVLRARHYFHAEVANFAQTQPGKLRTGLCHLPKNVLDGPKTVTAAEFLKKVTQDFQILPGLTWRPDAATK